MLDIKSQNEGGQITTSIINHVVQSTEILCSKATVFKQQFERGEIVSIQELRDECQQILEAAITLKKFQEEEKADIKSFKTEVKSEHMDTSPSKIIIPAKPQNGCQPSQIASSTISLELSDYYETLPVEFQKAVSKRNPELQYYINTFESYQDGRRFKKNSKTQLIIDNIVSPPSQSCPICFTRVKQLASHTRNMHTPPYHSKKLPFLWFLQEDRQYSCPAQCGFAHIGKNKMLEHLVLMHSQREIPDVSREYCKFLLGWDYKRVDVKGESIMSMVGKKRVKQEIRKSESDEEEF